MKTFHENGGSSGNPVENQIGDFSSEVRRLLIAEAESAEGNHESWLGMRSQDLQGL